MFKKLDELNIEQAGIQRVNHSKMDSIKRAVRILAIKAAKDKADYLLQAIGEQTAKPLIVRDTDINPRYDDINAFRGNVYIKRTRIRRETILVMKRLVFKR